MAIEGSFGFPGLSAGVGAQLRVMGVDYTSQVWGRTIQISTGQRAMNGAPIWASPVAFHFTPFTALDSGSGVTSAMIQTMLNASATRSFAVSFGYNLAPDGQHGVTGVSKIWVNDLLVFDVSLPNTQRSLPIVPPVLSDGGGVIPSSGALAPLKINFTFYQGSEDQQPDAEIAADQGNLTCAFRGLAYMVVHQFPVGYVSLTDPYTIPDVRVELLDGMHFGNNKTTFATLPGSVVSDLPLEADWNAGFIYGWSGVNTTSTVLHKYSIDGAAELLDTPIVGNVSGAPYTSLNFNSYSTIDAPLSANGSALFFTAAGTSSNSMPIVCINGDTGQIVSQFGSSSNNLDPTDINGTGRTALGTAHWVSDGGLPLANVPGPEGMCIIKAIDNGTVRSALVSVTGGALVNNWVTPIPYNSSGVFDADVDYTENFKNALHGADLSPVVAAAPLPLFTMAMQQGGGAAPNQDAAYAVATTTGIWLVKVGWRNGRLAWLDTTFVVQLGGSFLSNLGTSIINRTIKQLQVDGKGTLVAYCTDEHGIPCVASIPVNYGPAGTQTPTPSGQFFKGIFPTVQNFTGLIPIPTINTGIQWASAMGGSNLSANDMGLPNGGNSTVDIVFTGNGVSNEVGPFVGESINNWLWDSTAQTIYFVEGGTIVAQAVNKVSGTPVTLGQLLLWIGLSYGYAQSALIIDPLLTDVIIGFKIESAVDIPTLLGQLAEVYQFSWLESEGQIKFVKQQHGAGAPNPSFTLGLDDLALVHENSLSQNDALVTMIDAPNLTASSTNLQYMDVAKDYALENQFFLQPQLISGQASPATQNVAVPIIMTAAEAYRRATQITVAQYAESVNLQIRLPQKYSMLEPSDTLAIVVPPFSYLVQIDETTFNTDHSISILGLNYKYDNTITVPDQQPHAPSGPGIFTNDSSAAAFDMPLVRQVDDGGQARCIVYTGAVPLQPANWHDAFMLFGPLNGNLSVLYDATVPLPDATMQGALPDNAFPFQTDNNTTINLILKAASSANFFATDDAGLLTGINAIIVGAPGRWELIYFRDVTVLNNKVIKLSGLLRGRNGTDTHIADHAGGDPVYLISSAATNFVSGLQSQAIAAASIGSNFTYQAMGVPARSAPGVFQMAPLKGYSFYPWAPSYYRGTLGSTAAGSGSPAYTNLGGTGDRRANIRISSNMNTALMAGSITNIIDGSLANVLVLAGAATNFTILFDFSPLGFPQRITEYRWTQSGGPAIGTYAFEASNDQTTWTTLDAGTVLGTVAVTTVTFVNASGFTYYRLRQTAGTTSVGPFIEEVEFKIVSIVGASNDVALQWTRRDRIGQQFVSFPQPMSEAAETYDLEICNGSGVVLRTVNGLTAPDYVYTAAQQTTDGLSPPLTQVQMRAYQKSAVTGRGFTKTGIANVS